MDAKIVAEDWKPHLLQIKHTPSFFREEIEKYVSESGMSYLDAILFYVEKHNIEEEVVPNLMKGNLKIKSALQEEAEDLNFLEKTDRLPI